MMITRQHSLFNKLICIFSILLLIQFTQCSMGSYHPEPDLMEQEFITFAKSLIGIPYVYGGVGKTGMDCSGLVVYMFERMYGIHLPHNTYQLYKKTRTLTMRGIHTGDLVFFREGAGRLPSHVGIYLRHREFIHTSSSKGVIISSLDNTYYKKRLCGVKRVRLP